LEQGPRNETPVSRQMFVNRNLHMGKVDLIGFDMDYTLAIYHLRRLEQLSYDLTVDRLIKHCGYADDIRQVPYDHSFVLRGVFVDKVRGNLLKIDRFGYVGRAYHGRTLLPDYRFAPPSGLWRHRDGPVEPPLRLADVGYDADGVLRYPHHRETAPESALADYLEQARAVFAGRAEPAVTTPVGMSADFEALRWFDLPPVCVEDVTPTG